MRECVYVCECVYKFVGSCLATKVFIGNLPAMHGKGVGHHKVGQWWTEVNYQQISYHVHDINWGALNHASQLMTIVMCAWVCVHVYYMCVFVEGLCHRGGIFTCTLADDSGIFPMAAVVLSKIITSALVDEVFSSSAIHFVQPNVAFSGTKTDDIRACISTNKITF